MHASTFFFLLIFGTISSDLPIPGNGILQPSLHYERYRQSEYKKDQPYYQWWYYWIRDTENDRHFAVIYGTTLCANTEVKSCDYDGALVSFFLVDNKQNKRLQKYEVYDRNAFSVSDEFHVRIHSKANETSHEIVPVNNDTYRIQGNMSKENTAHVWFCDNCPPSMAIEWNLTLTRIYGCADMNWGENMPSSPPRQEPSDKYAWGWYYVNRPSDQISGELSIIAGTGLSYEDALLRTMDGRFCDVRLNESTHVELRMMKVRDLTFDSCNDGKIHRFDVERSNWTNITDSFGNATIPLRQVVTLESDSYWIRMDFNSIVSNYNRILFPFVDYVFSDFEALGVSTNLLIIDKRTATVFLNETLKTGGLEYGYRFNVTVPPFPNEIMI